MASTLQSFQCIRSLGYQTAFVRIYQNIGAGENDLNGPGNLLNANAAGMGIEVYMTPQSQPTSKYCAQQLYEAYTFVTNSGIRIVSLWFQVTSPNNWSPSQLENRNFIQSCINEAPSLGIRLQIYTNAYEWQEITGGWTGHPLMNLWYWDYNGPGPSGSSSCTFSDFLPFGGWTNAQVKKYASLVYMCGTYVGLNCYSVNKDATNAITFISEA
uniref:Lysozyme n=1 Tax=Plectus sambesii TaxID=2011161 RepID=A0A914W997_9BILA